MLFTDPAHRKKAFPMIGGPGVVLRDAMPVGTWRGAAKGKRYVVTVELFTRLPKSLTGTIEAEAQRVAIARGHAEASVTID